MSNNGTKHKFRFTQNAKFEEIQRGGIFGIEQIMEKYRYFFCILEKTMLNGKINKVISGKQLFKDAKKAQHIVTYTDGKPLSKRNEMLLEFFNC